MCHSSAAKSAHANITNFNPLGNTCHIYWSDELDSTNLEALRHISADSEHSANMSVIAAKVQTSGRGQGDHKWHSKPGENLTFSIILRYGSADSLGTLPSVPAAEQHAVSALTALSVVDYLCGKGIVAHIKLENDIYIGDMVASGKKICGILIKHHVRGAFLADSVLGVGININQTVFPADLPNPTSVALQIFDLSAGTATDKSKKMDIAKELEGFVRCFEALYPLLLSSEGRIALEERFRSLVIH